MSNSAKTKLKYLKLTKKQKKSFLVFQKKYLDKDTLRS